MGVASEARAVGQTGARAGARDEEVDLAGVGGFCSRNRSIMLLGREMVCAKTSYSVCLVLKERSGIEEIRIVLNRLLRGCCMIGKQRFSLTFVHELRPHLEFPFTPSC